MFLCMPPCRKVVEEVQPSGDQGGLGQTPCDLWDHSTLVGVCVLTPHQNWDHLVEKGLSVDGPTLANQAHLLHIAVIIQAHHNDVFK